MSLYMARPVNKTLRRCFPTVSKLCPNRILSFAKIPSAGKALTRRGWVERIGEMPVLFLFAFRFVRLLLSGHQAIAIENVALRMQIAAFQRKRKRPLLTTLDRLFWISLRSVWSNWRRPLLYVQPDTVVRWQRERFRKFWARLSKPQRRRRGRPATAAELRRLIEQMAAANPLWRAPRIHGGTSAIPFGVFESGIQTRALSRST